MTETNTLSEHARKRALAVYEDHRSAIERADRADLEAFAMLMIQKREVDGLNGRVWDVGAHLYFENAAVSMMEKIRK